MALVSRMRVAKQCCSAYARTTPVRPRCGVVRVSETHLQSDATTAPPHSTQGAWEFTQSAPDLRVATSKLCLNPVQSWLIGTGLQGSRSGNDVESALAEANALLNAVAGGSPPAPGVQESIDGLTALGFVCDESGCVLVLPTSSVEEGKHCRGLSMGKMCQQHGATLHGSQSAVTARGCSQALVLYAGFDG